MARSWYAFINGDPNEVSNYIKVDIEFTCLCGSKICVIYASGISSQPISPLSPNMKLYIQKAMLTGYLQPQDPFFAKKYVYLRDY